MTQSTDYLARTFSGPKRTTSACFSVWSRPSPIRSSHHTIAAYLALIPKTNVTNGQLQHSVLLPQNWTRRLPSHSPVWGIPAARRGYLRICQVLART